MSAADSAIAAARAAITAATAVPAHEKTAHTRRVDALAGRLSSAKTARQAAMDDADNMAMMATAMKLHAGISAPTGSASNATRRHAAYGEGANANDIAVTIGTAAAVNLSEDKKTSVADNHGWQGKVYKAAPTNGGTYEARVYSNVGEPTEGQKFSAAYPYDTRQVSGRNTELIVYTADVTVAGRVASPSFDQSAGKKEFKLPDNTVRVVIAGSYDGVSGAYYCAPNTNETCSASVAAKGFTLAGGSWTFKATNADTPLTSTPDAIYASYGWWIHKSADGRKFTASAFVSDKGDVPNAFGLTALQGTATYMGGAAGKYALYSSSGGTNDAGHFTARATLNADFSDNSISGAIDNFMGADGMSRDWSVKLNKTDISDTGVIDGTDGDDSQVGTVWTMGGTAAARSGQWSGSLQDNGSDGVPKVGTGTFYTEFGRDGKMVGGFGVNKQ